VTIIPPRSTNPPRQGWMEGIQLPPSPSRKPAPPRRPIASQSSWPQQGRHDRRRGRPRLDRRCHAVLTAELCSTMPPSHRRPHVIAAVGGEAPPLKGEPCCRHHHQGFARRVLWRRREDENKGRSRGWRRTSPPCRLGLGDAGARRGRGGRRSQSGGREEP
jgi:hypothetical protein